MARVYRLGTWRRVANALVRQLVALGLGPPHTYLLTVRGRTTGRAYSTPVRLIEDPDARWLVAPYGAVAWVRNARAAPHVTLTRGRRSEVVRLTELDARAAGPVLKRYATEVPITRPFFDARPHAPVDAFVAQAAGHPVFRVDPA